jgi:hypothetical protein
MTLKVIGAGFGRTGTASAKLALERLGLGPCHHMSEVLPNPARVALWTRIGEQSSEGRVDPELWNEAFAGYSSTVDWPACTHWRALMDHFPGAKVLLTHRSAESWFESVNATILSPASVPALGATPLGGVMQGNIWRLFSEDGEIRLDDRELMIQRYERHVSEVLRTVPEERLLVHEAKDGWRPLCAFLGVDIPDEPYPHVNTKEETEKVMAMLMGGGGDEEMSQAAEAIYRKGG